MATTGVTPTRDPSPRPWALAAAGGGGTIIVGAVIAAYAGAAAVGILEWLLVAAIVAFGVPLAVYDFRERRLPNRLIWPLYAVVGALVAECGLFSVDPTRVGVALLAAGLMWGIYFALGMLGAVAFGDVKLAGALGLALGWWGIIPALLGAAAAYILALPHAVVHVTAKRGHQIPFGPYMIAGALAVSVWAIVQS